MKWQRVREWRDGGSERRGLIVCTGKSLCTHTSLPLSIYDFHQAVGADEEVHANIFQSLEQYGRMRVFYFLKLSLPSNKTSKYNPHKNTFRMLKTWRLIWTRMPLILHMIYLPVDPRSLPPPSSILDQFGVDFPLEALSAITSRLSEDIGEWRLPTNLVNENMSMKSKRTKTHFSESTSEKFLIAL